MTRSKSAKMASNGSPCSGRVAGSARRHSPGATRESTGIAFGRGEVIGDPVDDAVAFAAEGLRIHVADVGRGVLGATDTPA